MDRITFLWGFDPSETGRPSPDPRRWANVLVENVDMLVPSDENFDLWTRETEFEDLNLVWKELDSMAHWRVKLNLAKFLVLYHWGGAFFSIDSTPGSSVRTMLATNRVSLVSLGGRSWHRRGTPDGPSIWDHVAYSPVARHPFFASCIYTCLTRIKLLLTEKVRNRIDDASDVDWCSGSHVFASVYARFPNKEQRLTPHRSSVA